MREVEATWTSTHSMHAPSAAELDEAIASGPAAALAQPTSRSPHAADARLRRRALASALNKML